MNADDARGERRLHDRHLGRRGPWTGEGQGLGTCLPASWRPPRQTLS